MAVSATLCRVTRFPTICGSVVLSMVGWMIVWVSERSSRARRRWKLTRFWAPASLPWSAPAQIAWRAAKQENLTFM